MTLGILLENFLKSFEFKLVFVDTGNFVGKILKVVRITNELILKGYIAQPTLMIIVVTNFARKRKRKKEKKT